MFGAIAKAAGLMFWGSADAEEKDEENDPYTPITDESKSEKESQYVEGKVTSLHKDYGIINKDIYFSLGCVFGGVRLQVGDAVNVLASRKSADDGWKADQVSLATVTSWDDAVNSDEAEIKNVPEVTTETVVGTVTRASDGEGLINNDIPFEQGAVSEEYIPYRGDWVTCDVETNNVNNTCHATKISPLRTKDFSGEINSFQNGFGYINRDIYVQFDACIVARNCVCRRGERVCGKALESNQGKCNWRAISLESPSSQNSPARLLQMPSIPVSPMQGKLMQALLQDNEEKYSVFVTKLADFGMLMVGQQKSLKLWIRNTGDKPISFLRAHFRGHAMSQFTVNPPQVKLPGNQASSNDTPTDGISLQPSMSASVKVDCQTKNYGQEKQLLTFEFEGFKIGRYLTVEVKDPTTNFLEPSAPYQRREMNRYSLKEQLDRKSSGDGWVVPGIRPIFSKKSVQLPNKLAQFPVNSDLRECIFNQEDPSLLYPVLKQPLMFRNYAQKFSLLLHLEEVQMEIDIQEYSLDRVCLRPVAEFLGLKVPGLAEGRPSLIIADKVILSEPGEDDGPRYEGYVHEVMNDEVLLKFKDNFHQDYFGQDYNVEFTFNRTPLRRCHQSVNFVQKLGDDILFPSKLELKKSKVAGKVNEAVKEVVKETKQPGSSKNRAKSTSSHSFFNSLLNERQRAACLRILGGQCRPVPYILFGPPGTGKTVTVVETVLQVFHHVSSSRILVCAPSNSAADLLAERLHLSGKISKGDMVRLNAFQRTEDVIPEIIQPYSMYAEDLNLVARYRIVVCTCATAGSFYGLRLEPGHFTHAFIDEAGQATEPECLVALGMVANDGGQTILAGDPMQLGPVLRSKHSVRHGLQQSLLERLINLPLYQRDEKKFSGHGCYDPFLVTKLINNYRSHPALMNLPSQIFYHDELQMCADKQMRERMCHIDILPNPVFPLIFHGIRGEDLREGNSPSWFNPVEAIQVMKYLQGLVSDATLNLTYDEIGIITPYRKQVEKIRLLIDRLDMEKVKVGSVEEFQGQERPAMIISTVRSHSRLVAYDQKFNLGFLSNPKRFNVAITRPQALLIIIGNPHVLAQDQYWVSLLKYCVDNKCYTGCDLPDCVKPVESSIIGEVADALEACSLEQDIGAIQIPSKKLVDAKGLEKEEAKGPSASDTALGSNVTNGKEPRSSSGILSQNAEETSVAPVSSSVGSLNVSQASSNLSFSPVVETLRTDQHTNDTNKLNRTSGLGSIVRKLTDSPTSFRGLSRLSSQEVGFGQISTLMSEPVNLGLRRSSPKTKTPERDQPGKGMSSVGISDPISKNSTLGINLFSDSGNDLNNVELPHQSEEETCSDLKNEASNDSDAFCSFEVEGSAYFSASDLDPDRLFGPGGLQQIVNKESAKLSAQVQSRSRKSEVDQVKDDLCVVTKVGQLETSSETVIEALVSVPVKELGLRSEEPCVVAEVSQLESSPVTSLKGLPLVLVSEMERAKEEDCVVAEAGQLESAPETLVTEDALVPVEEAVQLEEEPCVVAEEGQLESTPEMIVKEDRSLLAEEVEQLKEELCVVAKVDQLESSPETFVEKDISKVESSHESLNDNALVTVEENKESSVKIVCDTEIVESKQEERKGTESANFQTEEPHNNSESHVDLHCNDEPLNCFLNSTDSASVGKNPRVTESISKHGDESSSNINDKHFDSVDGGKSLSSSNHSIEAGHDLTLLSLADDCASVPERNPVPSPKSKCYVSETNVASVQVTVQNTSAIVDKNCKDEAPSIVNAAVKQHSPDNIESSNKILETTESNSLGASCTFVPISEISSDPAVNLCSERGMESPSDSYESSSVTSVESGPFENRRIDLIKQTTEPVKMSGVKKSQNRTKLGRGRALKLLAEQHWISVNLEGDKKPGRKASDISDQNVANKSAECCEVAQLTSEKVDGCQSIGTEVAQTEKSEVAVKLKPPSPEQPVIDFVNSVYSRGRRSNAKKSLNPPAHGQDKAHQSGRNHQREVPPRFQKTSSHLADRNRQDLHNVPVDDSHLPPRFQKTDSHFANKKQDSEKIVPDDSQRSEPHSDSILTEYHHIQAEVIMETDFPAEPSIGRRAPPHQADNQLPQSHRKYGSDIHVNRDDVCTIQAEVISENFAYKESKDQEKYVEPRGMSWRRTKEVPPRFQNKNENYHPSHQNADYGRHQRIEAEVVTESAENRSFSSQQGHFDEQGGSMSHRQYRNLPPRLQKKFVANVISNMSPQDLGVPWSESHGTIKAVVITEQGQDVADQSKFVVRKAPVWQQQFSRLPRFLQKMGHSRFYKWYTAIANSEVEPDWDLIMSEERIAGAHAVTGDSHDREGNLEKEVLPGSYPWHQVKKVNSSSIHQECLQMSDGVRSDDNEGGRLWFRTSESDWPGARALGKSVNEDKRKNSFGRNEHSHPPKQGLPNGETFESEKRHDGHSESPIGWKQNQQKKQCLRDGSLVSSPPRHSGWEFTANGNIAPDNSWVAGTGRGRGGQHFNDRGQHHNRRHQNKPQGSTRYRNSSGEQDENNWRSNSGGRGRGQFKSGYQFDSFNGGMVNSDARGRGASNNRDIPAFSFDNFAKGVVKKGDNRHSNTTNIFNVEKRDVSRGAKSSPGRPPRDNPRRNEAVHRGKFSLDELEKVLKKSGKVEQKEIPKSKASAAEKKTFQLPSALEKKSVQMSVSEKKSVNPSVSEKKSVHPSASEKGNPFQFSKHKDFDRDSSCDVQRDRDVAIVVQKESPTPKASAFERRSVQPVQLQEDSESDEDYDEQRDSDVIIESSDEENAS